MTTAGIERVHLYGNLAEMFGPVLDIKSVSPLRAFQIIEANFPNQFMRALRAGSFHIWYGDEDPEAADSLTSL